MRELRSLPKAHLHLHFTGSMSIESLRHVGELAGKPLHDSLVDAEGLLVPFNERGWFRFQRLYDMARHVVNNEAALRFIVAQAARDDAAEGSRRLELQVDPSSYAPFVGGLAPALEIILDEARRASAETGVQVAIIVAASRVRHPLDARTMARLAAHHASENGVVAFGLSNNERAGTTADWEPAFRIARNAGLPGVPHAGELLGPSHVREVVEHLRPPGWVTACGRLRIHGCSRGWSLRVSPSRSVPARTCTWASMPTPRTFRCANWSRRAPRSRWAPTTRCCSSLG